jgi:hypothetical protein
MKPKDLKDHIEKFSKFFESFDKSKNRDYANPYFKKRFEEYFQICFDSSEITTEACAELYCMMLLMMNDIGNFLSGGKKYDDTSKVKSVEDLAVYNMKVFNAINELPEAISYYIKNHPCYTYNEYVEIYFELIIQRISVLLQGIVDIKIINLDEFQNIFYDIIKALDNTIENIFHIKEKSKQEFSIFTSLISKKMNDSFYANSHLFYFDRLFGHARQTYKDMI